VVNIWAKQRLKTRDRRNLHNEELHDLYYSSNIIAMMTSRTMSLAEHVAQMQEEK
jgi:hypothetical protein